MAVGWIPHGLETESGEDAVTADGVLLVPWGEESAQLEPGDRLTAIDGVALSEMARHGFGRNSSPPTWQVGDTQTWTVLRNNVTTDVSIELKPNALVETLFLRQVGLFYLVSILFCGMTILLYLRQPDLASLTPLLIFACALTAFVLIGGQRFRLLYLIDPLQYVLILAPLWPIGRIAISGILHLLLVFPTKGRLFERWERPIVFLLYALPIAAASLLMLRTYNATDNGLLWTNRWLNQDELIQRSLLMLCVPLMAWSWWRGRSSLVYRQQFRVLMASILSFPLGAFLVIGLPRILGFEQIVPGYLAGVFLIPTPIGLYVALTRYRLFAVDRLLNRSVVFGVLIGLVTLLYAGLVGLAALFLQTRVSLPIALLVIVALVLALQPVRRWVQRVINRAMYGQREDPFVVFNKAAQIMKDERDLLDMATALVTHIGQSMQIPFVGLEIAQVENVAFGSAEIHPITWQSDLRINNISLGTLKAAQRPGDAPLTSTESGLLQTIAEQTATVLHSRLLASKLISVRIDERKRLQQDLHDRLGPSLTAVSIQLDMARNLLETDPQKAAEILQRLDGDTQLAVEEVRHILYDLRPSVLDQIGLVAALEALVSEMDGRVGMSARFESVGLVEGISAELESTLYQITSEALQNVSRHARASEVLVQLEIAEQLALLIQDNGVGLPEGPIKTGIGLASINRRVEKLAGQVSLLPAPGGGTKLLVVLPIASQTMLSPEIV